MYRYRLYSILMVLIASVTALFGVGASSSHAYVAPGFYYLHGTDLPAIDGGYQMATAVPPHGEQHAASTYWYSQVTKATFAAGTWQVQAELQVPVNQAAYYLSLQVVQPDGTFVRSIGNVACGSHSTRCGYGQTGTIGDTFVFTDAAPIEQLTNQRLLVKAWIGPWQTSCELVVGDHSFLQTPVQG